MLTDKNSADELQLWQLAGAGSTHRRVTAQEDGIESKLNPKEHDIDGSWWVVRTPDYPGPKKEKGTMKILFLFFFFFLIIIGLSN